MSPTQAETLTAQSTPEEVSASISACISQLVGEGREQDQAIAICHSQARVAGATVPAVRGEGTKTSRRIAGV